MALYPNNHLRVQLPTFTGNNNTSRLLDPGRSEINQQSQRCRCLQANLKTQQDDQALVQEVPQVPNWQAQVSSLHHRSPSAWPSKRHKMKAPQSRESTALDFVPRIAIDEEVRQV